MTSAKRVRVALLLCTLLGSQLPARAAPNFLGQTARPLHFLPDGNGFLVTNGPESFNRPLYGGNTPFRVDAGDKPELSLYLPGRGGTVRVGFKTVAGTKWLHDAATVQARYADGAMLYRVSDAALPGGFIEMLVVALNEADGVALRVTNKHVAGDCELILAYGGVTGVRGGRDGDIGTEREPISQYFQLKPEFCAANTFDLTPDGFTLRSKPADIAGVMPDGAQCSVADAAHWNALDALLTSNPSDTPVVVARLPLQAERPAYAIFQRLRATPASEPATEPTAGTSTTQATTRTTNARAAYRRDQLKDVFDAAERHMRSVASRIVVDTPDAFINAAVPALCVAADGVWDSDARAFMHGAVAWRTPLLGWRGAYAGDVLGQHDRTRDHLMRWFPKQNTKPIVTSRDEPTTVPADESTRLARNEPQLHSNGDLSNSHYDMNLPAMDVLFRHLLWTGDLDFARRVWPTIERHLAWERRLFRRPFGPDKLPLYEAYCAIWASDDLQYHGGGATHATAYNYYHNTMAARVARLIGEDPTPYEREAALIRRAMREHLWLADRGWYAEWRDLLGLQLAHPNTALWTFYHTVDSEAATPTEAWQMSRFVDTQIPKIPIEGENVPPGEWHTLPTTTWMPYVWSTNNVVMGEAAHTSLAYWQANRPDAAFKLFKGLILDSMYQGLCPGNVGMATKFDMARGETQRDFSDGVGTVSRALVEGLFGIRPDALTGELVIQPGFPAEWNHASIEQDRISFKFAREGLVDRYTITPRFDRQLQVSLCVRPPRDDIASVTSNGQACNWRSVQDAVGEPRVEIMLAPGDAGRVTMDVEIRWKGDVLNLATPAAPFAQVGQGAMRWLAAPPPLVVVPAIYPMTDWSKLAAPLKGDFETLDLAPSFNDRVTQIFKNEYRSPRSPYVSLAVPLQGIGSWVHFDPTKDRHATANIDDAGLRGLPDKSGRFMLPQGIPFATPGVGDAKNVAFVSQWDNFPRELVVPLAGRARHAYLLMAGSTNSMQSRFDNGEVIVTYADGSVDRLALENPTTWWPIEQDYRIDDYAFRRPEPIPLRLDLKTGVVRQLDIATFKGKGGRVDGGSATLLDLRLDPAKELKSITVRALANEVVIGLMSVTLQR